MYGVFRDRRDIILSTVIAHKIGHGVVRDAQYALGTLRFTPRRLLKPEALEWVAKYEAG